MCIVGRLIVEGVCVYLCDFVDVEWEVVTGSFVMCWWGDVGGRSVM